MKGTWFGAAPALVLSLSLSLSLSFPLPVAAGQLSGTVRGPDGEPVGGAIVVAVGGGAIEVEADAEGRYAASVPPDRYRILARPPDGSPLAHTWAPSAVDPCGGEAVWVGEDDVVAGVDVEAQRGATARGTIAYPDGRPAAGAVVTAVTDQTHARSATVGSDGAFEIAGIIAGGITFAVVAEGVPVQFADGAFSATETAPVGLSAGADLDLGDIALAPGVTVGGEVRIDGALATEGTAFAYGRGALIEVPIGAEGRFTASGLPPGETTAWAIVEGYATTYHPDAASPAAYVALADGERFDGMDIALPPEATLAGTLVASGRVGWSQVALSLVNDAGTVGVVAEIDGGGGFSFAGLHGGTYVLHFAGADAGLVEGPWRDEFGLERRIEVPASGSLHLGEVPVAEGAEIRGVVTEAGTGRPVVGAWVSATSEGTGRRVNASSSRDGTFQIRGLWADAYALTATAQRRCPSDDGWVTIHAPNVPSDLFSIPATVEAGQVAPWSPTLPPDDDHDGMGDGWERSHGLDPRRDDGDRDPDRDGFTNLDEYLLGTDPHDADRRCGCALGGGPARGGVSLGWGVLVAGGIFIGWRRRCVFRSCRA